MLKCINISELQIERLFTDMQISHVQSESSLQNDDNTNISHLQLYIITVLLKHLRKTYILFWIYFNL